MWIEAAATALRNSESSRKQLGNKMERPEYKYADREDSARSAGQAPDSEKLKDIVRLQASLWQVAQQLPPGVERENAVRQIIEFQGRTKALIRRRWQR